MSKTNTGLVAYAKAQLGNPYWFGTFGQTAGADLLAAKRRQYPGYYRASDFEKQLGRRVHDCCGLIKGYLWSDTPTSQPRYNAAQDVDADTMRFRSGPKDISTIPEVPGVLVFAPQHVGVYIGGGTVIEARGHDYGVVQTKLADRPWRWWGYCPYIGYEKEETDSAPPALEWAKSRGIDISRADKTATVADLIAVFYALRGEGG